MRTIKIPKQSRAVNALLKRARHENVILRSAEGTEFILAEIDDFNREMELTRQNKQLMKRLEGRAKQKGTVSFGEAKRILGINE